jgi:hypothetical protein
MEMQDEDCTLITPTNAAMEKQELVESVTVVSFVESAIED